MVSVGKKGLIYFWALLHATAGKHLTLEKKKTKKKLNCLDILQVKLLQINLKCNCSIPKYMPRAEHLAKTSLVRGVLYATVLWKKCVFTH